jgi:predicted ATPase with chaperone activity
MIAGALRLAHSLTTILPAMRLAEALETTCLHRVAGRTGARTALVTTRPFRAPPQTISDVGRIGGGPLPVPGEVSLAHDAILCLDELPKFRRDVLEKLRQLPENGIAPDNLSGLVDLRALLVLARQITSSERSPKRLSLGST